MRIRRDGHSLPLAASLCLFALSLDPVAAQLLGPEFQVNLFSTGLNLRPAVAADDAGRFVVVWSGTELDPAGGVLVQRFDAAGGKLGGEFLANVYTTENPTFPVVAADGTGSFVVVWSSEGFGVIGRGFTSAGSPVGGEFQVNTYSTNLVAGPAVAAAAPGSFIATWSRNKGVFAQRFDAAGNREGVEFQVNTYSPTGSGPRVAADRWGDFVIVWTGEFLQGGGGSGAFGQLFDASGSKVGNEFQVNSYTSTEQGGPAVAMGGSGEFVVVWGSFDQDGSYAGVFGQRYDPAGTKRGGEFQVNSYTTGSQTHAAVAADSSGEFTVAWSFHDVNTYGLFGQRYDSFGSEIGGEFAISSYTTGWQYRPAVAADGSGNFVVAWESSPSPPVSAEILGRQLFAAIFFDTFENGTVCEWDAAVGSGDSCP